MSWKLIELTPKNADAWDKFVLSHPIGSVHQTADWAIFQNEIHGRGPVHGYAAEHGGKIEAAILCVQMNTGFLGKKWWYAPRGPVFDPAKPAAGEWLLTESAKKLQKYGGIFLRTDPYVSDEFRFDRKMRKSTQQYQPTDTLVLDLTQSDDELRAAMKRKGRYNINLAEKKGVTCESVAFARLTQKNLKDYWRLTSATTDRDGFAGHPLSYYEKFLKFLPKYATLFFAYAEDGSPVATAISTFCGKKSIYYFGASTSDPEYRNLMAPYRLQWEMMQEAKKRGCTSYDFLGIAPENQPAHPYAGISEFKWKFGGARQTFAPGRELVFDKFWYTLYRIAKKLR